MKKVSEVFMNGLVKENPTFIQLLGMCPTLAVTTSVTNGVGMGLSATAVLICSNAIISLLRKIIPSKVRIAAYIVIIAAFVTVIQMCLNAYVPSLADSLGIFIPLIVVNCIILARAESFASKNNVFLSAVDGLGMGLGFTVALTVISAVRELLGTGCIAGIELTAKFIEPASIAILAPGGFLILGMIVAAVQYVMNKKEGK